MKKVYEAPQLEVEEYALSASVAGSSCTVRLNMGPGSIGNQPACSDFRTWDTSINKNVPTDTEDPNYGLFYKDICDCYVTPARIKALIQS